MFHFIKLKEKYWLNLLLLLLSVLILISNNNNGIPAIQYPVSAILTGITIYYYPYSIVKSFYQKGTSQIDHIFNMTSKTLIAIITGYMAVLLFNTGEKVIMIGYCITITQSLFFLILMLLQKTSLEEMLYTHLILTFIFPVLLKLTSI